MLYGYIYDIVNTNYNLNFAKISRCKLHQIGIGIVIEVVF